MLGKSVPKNKDNDLTFFQVGENCPYKRHTEALLSAKGDTVEIRGPHGIYTKQ